MVEVMAWFGQGANTVHLARHVLRMFDRHTSVRALACLRTVANATSGLAEARLASLL